MTNKENLILDITSESQLETYANGLQRVGFYDGFKAGEPVLYIYVRAVKDRNTIVRRKAGERFVNGQAVCEKKLFARAYDKYLVLKSSKVGSPNKEAELEAKVKELEAKVEKKPKAVKVKEEKEAVAIPVVSLAPKSKSKSKSE